jgi:hypothetical protein
MTSFNAIWKKSLFWPTILPQRSPVEKSRTDYANIARTCYIGTKAEVTWTDADKVIE